MKKYFGLLFILLLIAGCGGGGGSTANNNNGSTAKYTVTFTADSNGYIAAGTATQTVTAGGSTTAVTASALASGYHFVDWTDGNNNHYTANPLTITNVTGAMTLKANFAQDTSTSSYTVTFLAGTGGTVTEASNNFVQTVANNGSTTTVTAVANPGFIFKDWTVNGTEVSTSSAFALSPVIASLTLTANFTAGAYISTLSVTDPVSLMVASFPANAVTDVTLQGGSRLFSTVEQYQVTVNVASVPNGATWEAHVVASDNAGNVIPMYPDPSNTGVTAQYLVITGNSSTATGTGTANVNAGISSAGYLSPTGGGHWTITSIKRTN